MAARSDTADRYRRLSDHVAELVAHVPPDQWDSPTPCEEWTVRELFAHLVTSQGMFLGLVGRPFESTVSLEADPVGAWAEARAQVQADLDDPERAAAPFEGFFGPSTFAEAVDRFVCMDLVVHGWDLAHATDQPDDIDPAEVERIIAGLPMFGDTLYSSGVCAPAIPVGDGVDRQTEMLALLGRDARAS